MWCRVRIRHHHKKGYSVTRKLVKVIEIHYHCYSCSVAEFVGVLNYSLIISIEYLFIIRVIL